MLTEEENKNRRIGLAVTVGFHALLLLAFLFMLAWRPPNPPIPDYGIEINFGMDDTGSGEIQPTEPVNESESEVDPMPEESQAEQIVEQETEVVEEIVEEEVAEEIPVPEVNNVQESPDVVEPEEKETPREEKKEEVKKEPTQPKVEKTKDETTTGASGKEGKVDEPQKVSQGDNVSKTGDKGKPEGKIDARALYGNPGGGDGFSFSMDGWTPDFIPKPRDTSNESGRLVFRIKIDDMGEIINVTTIERGVSPAIEKIYKDEIYKLTFSKTSDNNLVAPFSTGTIAFILKSQ